MATIFKDAALGMAKSVRLAREGSPSLHSMRAREILIRAEKELASLRTAAEACEQEEAQRYRSDAAELEAAIAELRREMELSGRL